MNLGNVRVDIKFTTHGHLSPQFWAELTLHQARPANERVYAAFYRATLPTLQVFSCPDIQLVSLSTMLNDVSGQPLIGSTPTSISRRITLYPEGVAVLCLTISLPGMWRPSVINQLINESLDGQQLWQLNGSIPLHCASLFDRYFEADTVTGMLNGRTYLESFSVVCATLVDDEPFDLSGSIKPIHELDVYAAAIRRMRSVSEVRIDEMRRRQSNLSTYVDDLVYLNYHNLFTFIPNGRGHLPSQFYEDAADLIKVLAALLFMFDLETYNSLRVLETPPRRLRELKRQTEYLERRRLDILRSLDTYRLLSGSSATRGQIFLSRAEQIFGIGPLRDSVEAKLQETEFILSSRYSVNLQRSLQIYSLVVGFVSMAISVVGVYLAVRYA